MSPGPASRTIDFSTQMDRYQRTLNGLFIARINHPYVNIKAMMGKGGGVSWIWRERAGLSVYG